MSNKLMSGVVLAAATVLALFAALDYGLPGPAAVAKTAPSSSRHVFEAIPRHHGLATGSSSSCPALSQGVSPRLTLPAKAVIRT
jgi:hypothetical protein